MAQEDDLDGSASPSGGRTRVQSMSASLKALLDQAPNARQVFPHLAALEADFDTCGESLFEFGRLVGEYFAPAQGGTYSTPQIRNLVQHLRCQGVRGVGQSSWGPAVFALVENERRALSLAARIQEQLGIAPGDVVVAKPQNRGAEVSQ